MLGLIFLTTLLLIQNSHEFTMNTPLVLGNTRVSRCRIKSQLYEGEQCLMKCMYEEQGLLDSSGNLILSKFKENATLLKDCLQVTNTNDSCIEVFEFSTCIVRRTSTFWQTYKECEQFYLTKPFCHQRCLLIKGGHLLKTGKMNINRTMYLKKPKEFQEILDICGKIVEEKNDNCARDIQVRLCTLELMRYSKPSWDTIVKCANEFKGYPYLNLKKNETSKICYTHCILKFINGEINETDFINSKLITNLRLNKTELRFLMDICESTTFKSVTCVHNMHLLQCIKNVHFMSKKVALNMKDCAVKLGASSIQFGKDTANDTHCYKKCLMTKDKQFEESGKINKTSLQKHFWNDTIINEALNVCSKNKKGNTCLDDLKNYACTISSILDQIYYTCGTYHPTVNSSTSTTNNNGVNSVTVSMTITKPDPCIKKCYNVNFRFLTENGDINTKYFIASGKSSSDVLDAVEMCKKYDKNPCEKSVNSLNCVQRILNPESYV